MTEQEETAQDPLPPVIGKIKLSKGDTLVLKSSQPLAPSTREAIAKSMVALFPDNKAIVLDSHITMEVMGPADMKLQSLKSALAEIIRTEPDEKPDGTILGYLVHDADEMAEIAAEALKGLEEADGREGGE